MNVTGRTGSGERPDQVVTVVPGNNINGHLQIIPADMPVRGGDGTGSR